MLLRAEPYTTRYGVQMQSNLTNIEQICEMAARIMLAGVEWIILALVTSFNGEIH